MDVAGQGLDNLLLDSSMVQVQVRCAAMGL
jgi:hypothetical protein